ncbi:MAG: Shedu anti-phage system protein SduA domain-containing protein [Acidobacteriota bacterium]
MTKLNLGGLDGLVSDFEAVLKNGSEEDVQQFLIANDILLDGFSEYGGVIKLSKVKLGAEHVTDFVLLHAVPKYSNSRRPGITLVEIERPDCPLFTKSGDPAAALTHAIRQTQDWSMWIQANRDYASKTIQQSLEKLVKKQQVNAMGRLSAVFDNGEVEEAADCMARVGFGERYLIIAGRRHSLSMLDRLRLERLNEESRQTSIVTYDDLLDRFLRRVRWARQFE